LEISVMPIWLRLSIAGAATLMVGMGIGRFSYSPMIPALIEAGALTETEAGYVGAANFAGYLAGALVAPLMRRIWGEADTLRLCLLFSLASLFASILPWGFIWLVVWRGLVGACVGVMMIYCLAIATRYAPAGKLGAATGITYTGVGVGILLAGTLVPWLLDHGLAAAWTGIALVGLTGAAVSFWGWRAAGPDTAAPAAKDRGPPLPKLKWTPTVIGLVSARTLFSLGLIPHTIYWVDYLVRGLGHDMGFGGWHWILFGIGAISGTYLWGRLADRIGFRLGLALAFGAVAAGIALPVIQSAGWALVISSVVVGAQPGLTAIMSGRFHQLMGAARMAEVWRLSALVSTIIQAIGAYGYVSLFAVTQSYGPIFLCGSAAMALGALIAILQRAPYTEDDIAI
jgi:predicted MFS family arabinose efflux permease